MTDFLTRISRFALGLTPVVQVLGASRYEPGPDMPAAEMLAVDDQEVDAVRTEAPIARASEQSVPRAPADRDKSLSVAQTQIQTPAAAPRSEPDLVPAAPLSLAIAPASDVPPAVSDAGVMNPAITEEILGTSLTSSVEPKRWMAKPARTEDAEISPSHPLPSRRGPENAAEDSKAEFEVSPAPLFAGPPFVREVVVERSTAEPGARETATGRVPSRDVKIAVDVALAEPTEAQTPAFEPPSREPPVAAEVIAAEPGAPKPATIRRSPLEVNIIAEAAHAGSETPAFTEPLREPATADEAIAEECRAPKTVTIKRSTRQAGIIAEVAGAERAEPPEARLEPPRRESDSPAIEIAEAKGRPRHAPVAMSPTSAADEEVRLAPPRRPTMPLLNASTREPASETEIAERRPAALPRAVARPTASRPAFPQEEREPSAPVVRVTIGRIEVRAVTPPAPAEPPAPPAPRLSLDEYLRLHNERSR